MIQKYVLGFLFDVKLNVALIRKNKPAWQAGKLNGIGGKVEEGEGFMEAMEREFEEETGVKFTRWEYSSKLTEEGCEMHVFRAICDDLSMLGLSSTTDEIVEIHSMKELLLSDDLLPSAQYLAIMCVYNMKGITVSC